MKSAVLLLVTLLALLQLTALAGASTDTQAVRRHASDVYPRSRPASTLARRATVKASKPKAKTTKAKATKAKATTAKAKTGKGATAAKRKTTKGAASAKGSTGAACAWTPGAKGRLGKRGDCAAGSPSDEQTGTYTLLCAQKATGAKNELEKRANFATLGKQDFFNCGEKQPKYYGADITAVAPKVLPLWIKVQQERNQRLAAIAAAKAKDSKNTVNTGQGNLKTTTAEYPRFNNNKKVPNKAKLGKDNQLVPDSELKEVGLTENDRLNGVWSLVEYPILNNGKLWNPKDDQGANRMLLAVPSDGSKIIGVWVATHNNAADGVVLTGYETGDKVHQLATFQKVQEKAKGPEVVLGDGAGKGADAPRQASNPWGAKGGKK